MPVRRRRRLVLAILVVLAVLLLWCSHRAPIVLGTFNIRTFPGEHTDSEAVAAAIVGLGADAFAVQEIVDGAAFQRVLDRASAITGRQYVMTLRHAYCRHSSFQIGVVYDARRIELVESDRLGDNPSCPFGQPPGLVALLRGEGGRRFTLASIHFRAGGGAPARRERLAQWAWLAAELPDLTDRFRAPVIVAGDFNSTGYLDINDPERRFIDTLVEHEGLQLPTAALGCSMYWESRAGHYDVSLLDHMLAPDDLELSMPEVLGMCAALRCVPQESAPAEYEVVSDHCPVRIELQL